MSDLSIVDAHHHFWDLSKNAHPWLLDEPVKSFRYGDYSAIRQSYLPADFLRDAAGQRLIGSVHVEAEWDPSDPLAETQWLTTLCQTYGLPTAIVGQAWFARGDIADVLARQAENPLVRGIRQKPAAAPTPEAATAGAAGSMSDPTWRAGYALLTEHGLSYDLQVPYWQLPEAAALAGDFPETLIILNHAGLPADRSAAGLARWRQAMACFAARANTAVKISGLGLPGRPWTVADNGPIVRTIIDLFGIDRCMFASNFPVDSLVADYDTIFDGFKAIVGDLPAADQAKLFSENAIRLYRLEIKLDQPAGKDR